MPFYKVNRIAVRKAFNLPSKAKQAFASECDINTIMARYQKTGLIEHVNEHGPRYGDAASYTDYHASMNLVAETNSMFSELPAQIRSQFDNDPSLFLDFIADPENREEMIKMGLTVDQVRSDAPQDPPDPETAPEGPDLDPAAPAAP